MTWWSLVLLGLVGSVGVGFLIGRCLAINRQADEPDLIARYRAAYKISNDTIRRVK
jgi:hypothetical protein